MKRRPPISTRTETLFPYTTLFRSILPVARRMGAGLVAITGNPASELARLADLHLDTSVAQEACPLNLAPTASTTAALALGDALAVACLEARGFGPEDFARSHPGGTLGRQIGRASCRERVCK